MGKKNLLHLVIAMRINYLHNKKLALAAIVLTESCMIVAMIEEEV